MSCGENRRHKLVKPYKWSDEFEKKREKPFRNYKKRLPNVGSGFIINYVRPKTVGF